MVQLAIRCHPRVPISSDELEGWLKIEVKDLHAQAPHATVRLSRLTQGLPDAHLDIGWLIELELDPDRTAALRRPPHASPQRHAPTRPSTNPTRALLTRDRHQRTSSMTAPVLATRTAGQALDTDSEAWVRQLSGHGRERDDAIERLHALLLRAARFEVGRRRPPAAVAGSDGVDDLAVQAADDALVAILTQVRHLSRRQPLHHLGLQVRPARSRREVAQAPMARPRAPAGGRRVGGGARRQGSVVSL